MRTRTGSVPTDLPVSTSLNYGRLLVPDSSQDIMDIDEPDAPGPSQGKLLFVIRFAVLYGSRYTRARRPYLQNGRNA